MKKHILRKSVMIDDFVGGKKGQQLIKELQESGEFKTDVQYLGAEDIQKIVLKRLEGRRYDLMLLVESGGAFLLGTREITSHADRVLSLPLSMHFTQNPISHFRPRGIDKIVGQFEDAIQNSKRIALVEGDVGEFGDSFKRLEKVVKSIKKSNPDAEVEVIVGVAHIRFLDDKFLNIVGYYVGHLHKLSDYTHRIDGNPERALNPEQKKLIGYWRRRKTLPLVVD